MIRLLTMTMMTMTMVFISEKQIFTRFLIHINKGNKGEQEVTDL